MVTQIAREFRTSRPTLYAIGQRAYQIMLPLPWGRPAVEGPVTAVAPMVAVTPTRIRRTILTHRCPAALAWVPR